MPTLYSCINYGIDVSEDAPVLYNEDAGQDMPHCYICHEVIRQHSQAFEEFARALDYAKANDRYADLWKLLQGIAFYVEPQVNAFVS